MSQVVAAAAQTGRAMTEERYANTKHTMLVYYGVLYAILWYDWASTLPQEYQKIWRSKAIFSKSLYLLNRYLPLITSFLIFTSFGLSWTADDCAKRLLGLEISLPTIGAAAGSVLLLLRCHAIWARSKIILGVLLVCCAGRLAGVIYFASHVRILRRPPGMTLGPCIPRDGSGMMTAFCLIPAAYDVVVCGLFLFRAFQLRKEFHTGPNSIVNSIAKHGCLYLIAIVVVNFAHLAWMKVDIENVNYASFGGAYMCFAFESIFSARLVLASKTDDSQSGTTIYTHSHLTSNRVTKSNSSPRGARFTAGELPMAIMASTTVAETRDDDDLYSHKSDLGADEKSDRKEMDAAFA